MNRLEILLLVATACSTIQLNAAYYLTEQGRQEQLPSCQNEVSEREILVKNAQGHWVVNETSTLHRCFCNPRYLEQRIELKREGEIMKAYHHCIHCECLRNLECAVPPKYQKTFNGLCNYPACESSDKCRYRVKDDYLGELIDINLCNCENESGSCSVDKTTVDGTITWMEYKCSN